VKAKLSLCASFRYGGGGGEDIATLVFNLGTRRSEWSAAHPTDLIAEKEPWCTLTKGMDEVQKLLGLYVKEKEISLSVRVSDIKVMTIVANSNTRHLLDIAVIIK